MTAMAYGASVKTRTNRVRAWAATWLAARRDALLERWLVPAEARFFDAYSQGGERRHGRLVIDYEFVARPRVRKLLRRAVSRRKFDHAAFEAEYRDWDHCPNIEEFRANAAHLAGQLTRRV